MTVNLRLGSPVIGNDFYGRKRELEKALELIRHNNIMLAAPRRVGKTSFSKKLLSLLEEEGWNTVFMDLEGIADIPRFFKVFHDKLMQLPAITASTKLKELVSKILPDIDLSVKALGGTTVGAHFSNQTDNLFDKLLTILKSLENHTIIIFDELTVLLESLTSETTDSVVKDFLNQFRALRQETADNCSWLICSSIGVRNFATLHKVSDTLNDVIDFELGAYTDEEADGLIQALCETRGITINEECRQYILNKIGWNIPYFIQLLVGHLPITEITDTGIIEDSYTEVLRLASASFDTWNERISKEYGENEQPAKRILLYLCVETQGKIRNDIYNHVQAIFPDFANDRFSILLRTLETDGYLTRSEGNYLFRSPLLRDYWKSTFCG